MIGFLSIIALGFFLGMRHATDPDHVIAVSTIVSQQRNVARAALVGAFWGLGHTLTIFIVGAGIILFNLVIPARIGLSMELAVAVMLIILGLVNVASFLRAMPSGPPRRIKRGRFIPTLIVTGTTFTAIRILIRPRRILTGLTKRRLRRWTVCWGELGFISTFDL